MYDITGEAAQSNLWGHANGLDTDGIQQRTRSRAFVIRSRTSGPFGRHDRVADRRGHPAATYRMRHTGNWKNGWIGAVTPDTGTWRTFSVS